MDIQLNCKELLPIFISFIDFVMLRFILQTSDTFTRISTTAIEFSTGDEGGKILVDNYLNAFKDAIINYNRIRGICLDYSI